MRLFAFALAIGLCWSGGADAKRGRQADRPASARDLIQPIPKIAIPDRLPLLATRNTVAFPGVVAIQDVGRDDGVAALRAALRSSSRLIIIARQRDPRTEDPARADLSDVVCVAKVLKHVPHPDGGGLTLLLGVARANLREVTTSAGYPSAAITVVPDQAADAAAIGASAAALRLRIRRLAPMFANLDYPGDLARVLDAIAEPGRFADAVAGTIGAQMDPDARHAGQQTILAASDVGVRLRELDDLVDVFEAELAKSQR